MKNKKYVIPELNLNAFYSFVKLGQSGQAQLLREKAVKVDQDIDGIFTVNLYFLNGFFVEEVISDENEIVNILPFKNGYKLEKLLEEKGIFELKPGY